MTDAHPSPRRGQGRRHGPGRVFVIPRKGDGSSRPAASRASAIATPVSCPTARSCSSCPTNRAKWSCGPSPANGAGDGEQLTTDGASCGEAVPSPDGKYVAHTDKNQRLFLFNVETKENKQLAESKVDEFEDLTWSPDSKWLAFAETAKTCSAASSCTTLRPARRRS